ncbi:MAG: hypothetical protein IKE09_02155 [Clostridiales bacterium]|nr:hypothetical protein [Clostridiales bacterium]
MTNKYNPGNKAFIIANNIFVKEVSILKCVGGFYTVRFIDNGGAMRVRENRLFPTADAAKAGIITHRPYISKQR